MTTTNCELCDRTMEFYHGDADAAPYARRAARTIKAGKHTVCKSELARAYNAPHSTEDGVVRWDSNGSAWHLDLLLAHTEVPMSIVRSTTEAQKTEASEFIAEYRAAAKRNPRKVSAEERYEMEAAFGKGTTVVNIITGERTVV